MKLLYALQGTGNGHITRAQEIVPILKKYALVDVLISGHQSQIRPQMEVDYSFSGVSLLYNSFGGLSYSRTFFKNNYCKALHLIRNFDIDKYDLIINDFEPITAWASKLKKHPIIGLGHQAALTFDGVPKPHVKNWFGEKILKHYAPCEERIGFHFEAFHPNVTTPVIRKAIRRLELKERSFYMVYLPSYSDDNIFEILSQLDVEWKVFSKTLTHSMRRKNVSFYPIDQNVFLRFFSECKGMLCNAGFETPAEALYLNKKLFVIPIKNQFEQAYNAFSLNTIGVKSSGRLNVLDLTSWLNDNSCFKVHYPDNIEAILVNNVLSNINKSLR